MPSRQKLLSMKFRQLRCVLNLKFEVDAPCETSMTPLIPSPLLPASAAYLIQTHPPAISIIVRPWAALSTASLTSDVPQQSSPTDGRTSRRCSPAGTDWDDVCRSMSSERRDWVTTSTSPATRRWCGWCTDPSSGSSPSGRPHIGRRSRLRARRGRGLRVCGSWWSKRTPRPRRVGQRVRAGACGWGVRVARRSKSAKFELTEHFFFLVNNGMTWHLAKPT